MIIYCFRGEIEDREKFYSSLNMLRIPPSRIELKQEDLMEYERAKKFWNPVPVDFKDNVATRTKSNSTQQQSNSTKDEIRSRIGFAKTYGKWKKNVGSTNPKLWSAYISISFSLSFNLSFSDIMIKLRQFIKLLIFVVFDLTSRKY